MIAEACSNVHARMKIFADTERINEKFTVM